MDGQSVRKLGNRRFSDLEKKSLERDWNHYYEVVAGRPVREFLRKEIRRFPAPGFAVDLGCGAGSETHYLLEQGWRVLAIDREPAALDRVRNATPEHSRDRLATQPVPFEAIELPPADLVWAGLSLPFCAPAHFDALWQKILSAIQPGGRFIGDFFGPDHAWASDPGMTFHSKNQVEGLLAGLQIEYFQEGKGEQQTALVIWQMFTVCAMK